MPIPQLYGYPIWFGRVKRRVAKKRLKRWRNSWMLSRAVQQGCQLSIGDMVNDCTGRNGKILETDAYYRRVSFGWVLFDIDFQTSNTGCSLRNCGVEPALTREQIEARMADYIREWVLSEPGRIWFGDEWQTKTEGSREILAVLESGGHVCDETGELLPEWLAKKALV